MRFFLVIFFIIAVIFGIITFQNDTEISVKFIKWSFSEHPAVILAVPFAVGLVIGISLLVPSLWKKAKAARTYKKRIQELEEELSRAQEEPEEEPEEQAEDKGEETENQPEDIKKPD